MLTVQWGNKALFCTLVYKAVLGVCKKPEWHQIQDPASPECESQMSTLPRKSALKSGSSYGCFFRRHQAETSVYLPSEKINICLCSPWTRPPVALIQLTFLYWCPRKREDMPPSGSPEGSTPGKLLRPTCEQVRNELGCLWTQPDLSPANCREEFGVPLWKHYSEYPFGGGVTVCQSQMKC